MDIQTDVANKVCSFRLENSEVDYQSQLAKFSQTNSHLADYVVQ